MMTTVCFWMEPQAPETESEHGFEMSRDGLTQSVTSSSESESTSMRGISSSSSCSPFRIGLGTMVDGRSVLSEVAFESVTVERRPIVLPATSNIFDGCGKGGGGFVEIIDICSLGSIEGKALSRKFCIG